MDFVELLSGTVLQGLIYALVSFGVYITYSILDFPDLGVDGTFPLGAAVTAVLLTQGVNAWATLPIALVVGALAGLITGFVHVRLRVRNLLAGIITMTALYSVNLLLAGSNLTVDRATDTIFTSSLATGLLGDMTLTGRKLVVSLVLVIVVKLVLDAYFKTKSGLLLRAVGDNATLVTTLARDRGNMKILGLMLSNALVALGGCIVCHETRSYSATMGTGQLVYGLAAVIIGVSAFRWYENSGAARHLRDVKGLRFFATPRGTTAVIVGSILYKLCIQLAMLLVPSSMMKFITAALFCWCWWPPAGKERRSSMLEVRDITKIYNQGSLTEQCLFDHFSLTVEEGQFVAVVGSNGSGKTSLLNIICGSIPIEGGDVLIGGKSIAGLKDYQRYASMGRVYQDPAAGTCPNLTVLENLSLADNKGKPFGLTRAVDKRRVEAYREQLASLGLGLEDKLQVRMGALSGGQRQAIALLMATMTPLKFLILDEHTAALDPKTAEIIMALTDKVVRQKQLTAIMVTHNLRYAVEYGDRILMMDRGHVVLDRAGEEKKNTSIDDILSIFNRISMECGN